jgi:hypothetical protein
LAWRRKARDDPAHTFEYIYEGIAIALRARPGRHVDKDVAVVHPLADDPALAIGPRLDAILYLQSVIMVLQQLADIVRPAAPKVWKCFRGMELRADPVRVAA